MQYKIFSIPVLGGNEETEIMNKFLRSVRVVETKKELINYDTGCYWTFCITYYWCPLKIFGDFWDFYFLGQPIYWTYKHLYVAIK